MLWLRLEEVIKFLLFNMEGGVRLQDTPIERTGNMENLIDAEMAREDLGRMTFMSLEVRKKLFVCLIEAIILFVVSY